MHVVRIESFEQFAKAIGVLNKVGGAYNGAGSSSDRRLIVNDAQYNALVDSKVISANHPEGKKRGKKQPKKKSKS